ncbi:metallopeptidase TldD-related protein (plasmid) [Streptomyces hirsutus]|uniref:metallopeptidase TldD-related protein n=1 Tax=Streptomyces hirsutus TaxID=35620 RepID=UPI002F91A6CC|nr:metallopeptidase TldD-related protein [Streptomyces hirsutus]
MTSWAGDRGLAQAGGDAAAMTAGNGHGCVTVRSHHRAAAAVNRTGTMVRVRRAADHTEQTTAALLLERTTRPGEPHVRHAAVNGYGTQAVRDVSRLVSEQSGRGRAGRILSTGSDVPLVPPAQAEEDPGRLAEDIIRRLPRGEALHVVAEAHAAVENRLLLPGDGPAVHETLRTGAIVVDVLKAGRRVAEADVAWSGHVLPDVDGLGEQVEQALRRAGAPRRSVGSEVQLLLLDGSAGAFLHEVCGHLLESTRQRPSLLAGRTTRHVAQRQLTVDDDPRHEGGFGAHHYTMLGTATRRRRLLDAGRLAGFLADTPDGPWRAEDSRHSPQPRMSHLELAPAPSPATMDDALGDASAPVVCVHRLGFGSLDHRDGTVVLEVKDASVLRGSVVHRLEPFVVTAEARHLLMDVRAVGCPATMRRWSAYCLATSGSLPVGASTPSLLTGPVSTLPHRPLAPPRAAVPMPRREKGTSRT